MVEALILFAAVVLTIRTIRKNLWRTCPLCKGAGNTYDGSGEACPRCDGSGWVKKYK